MDLTSVGKMKNTDDFEYAVQMTRWLLKPLGIWPLKSSSYITIFFRFISIGGCSFLLAFLMIPFCLQMLLVEKDLGVFFNVKVIFNVKFFFLVYHLDSPS